MWIAWRGFRNRHIQKNGSCSRAVEAERDRDMVRSPPTGLLGFSPSEWTKIETGRKASFAEADYFGSAPRQQTNFIVRYGSHLKSIQMQPVAGASATRHPRKNRWSVAGSWRSIHLPSCLGPAREWQAQTRNDVDRFASCIHMMVRYELRHQIGNR